MADAPPKPTIPVERFFEADVRVGVVTRAEPFPGARKPSLKLDIDFGPLGVKRSSAQITQLYTPAALVGRQVVAVVNFPPRRIAGYVSEVLVLGAIRPDGTVHLLAPDPPLPVPGDRIG